MRSPDLLKSILASVAGVAVVAGATIDSNGTRLDMAGYEGVLFIQVIDDSVATGVATLKVEQNVIDSDTGMAALAGAVATATSATNDDLNGKLLMVDVFRPRERYVQAVRTSLTANIAYGQLIAIRYGTRKLPVASDATVLSAVSVTSPAEA